MEAQANPWEGKWDFLAEGKDSRTPLNSQGAEILNSLNPDTDLAGLPVVNTTVRLGHKAPERQEIQDYRTRKESAKRTPTAQNRANEAH